MSAFSTEEKLKCIRRELQMRRMVYGNRIDRKLMTQEEAEHEMALMRAIRDDYEAKLKEEIGQGELGL